MQKITPLGCMNIAVPPSGPVGLTAGIVTGTTHFTIPPNTNLALIVCETASVRWRDDNIAPGTSTGMLLSSTAPVLSYSGDLSQLQFLSVSGTVTVDVAVYQLAG
ncbi:MAG: hypothetical protein ACLP19_18185 [Xanthobacteraceae bacterium]